MSKEEITKIAEWCLQVPYEGAAIDENRIISRIEHALTEAYKVSASPQG